MDARFKRWTLAGVLAGTALGLGACWPTGGQQEVVGGRGQRVLIRPENVWTPPSPAEQALEGVGGAGMAGTEAQAPQVSVHRGPGGSGEVVGTGVPEESTVYGYPGRANYVGPEPVIPPPAASAVLPAGTPAAPQPQR